MLTINPGQEACFVNVFILFAHHDLMEGSTRISQPQRHFLILDDGVVKVQVYVYYN